MDLKERIKADLKQAMRDRDQARVDAIRIVMAAIQRREIDERTTLDDAQVIAVIEKLIKQARDAVAQFTKGRRQDLVDKENKQIAVFESYTPEPLSDTEVEQLIDQAIDEGGASSIKDMGKVMGILKSKLQGRADMGMVSGRVKSKLVAPG